MYVIRFTIRKKSSQRKLAKHTYLLQSPSGRSIVGNYVDGGSSPVTLAEASRFATDSDATEALIKYLEQIGAWNRKMWIKNPVIVETDD